MSAWPLGSTRNKGREMNVTAVHDTPKHGFNLTHRSAAVAEEPRPIDAEGDKMGTPTDEHALAKCPPPIQQWQGAAGVFSVSGPLGLASRQNTPRRLNGGADDGSGVAA